METRTDSPTGHQRETQTDSPTGHQRGDTDGAIGVEGDDDGIADGATEGISLGDPDGDTLGDADVIVWNWWGFI